MPDTFDAIIIGTGFGATVAASALRAKKKRVLMLESGHEIEFPDAKDLWPRF